MTIKEFFETKEPLTVNCLTEKEAIRLTNLFHEAGYTWNAGQEYRGLTYWHYKGREFPGPGGIWYHNSHLWGDEPNPGARQLQSTELLYITKEEQDAAEGRNLFEFIDLGA